MLTQILFFLGSCGKGGDFVAKILIAVGDFPENRGLSSHPSAHQPSAARFSWMEVPRQNPNTLKIHLPSRLESPYMVNP
jgi:hypothetical protein